MKYIAFLIVLLIPFCLFSQEDILLSYQKDSIWNDSLQDYQIQPGVWLGDGSKGRFILRRSR